MALLTRAASRIGLVMLATLLTASSVSAVASRIPEYQLKAAFLFNFAHFVSWPNDAFTASDSPITIGILGPDPFGATLDDIVANETVGGRRLAVERLTDPASAQHCHILFVASPDARFEHELVQLRGRSVLTVGDASSFASRSGIVGFVMADKRLRLQINLAAAKQSRLSISSKLLRQAQIVRAQK